jgi:CRISPR-associated endonuclease Cas2
MAKPLSQFSTNMLASLGESNGKTLHDIYNTHTQAKSKKSVYDTLYRLISQELVKKDGELYHITPEGQRLIHTVSRKKDGIWKIVVFDIPESKRYIRNVLRSKLQSLGFQKWQNSIWVSPFELHPDVENELNELATKMFIRLIKTTDINYTADLDKLFAEDNK